MKYLIVSIVLALLTGCLTLRPAKLPSVTDNKTDLVVNDLRSQDQGQTEILSYIVTSCNYGVQRLGDEWTQPNKVDYLSAVISKNLPQKSNLVINDFVIYFNTQYRLRKGNVYRGPIWELIECDDNTDKFTKYSHEENASRKDIIIGTLSGSLDGVPFSERVTSFPVCPRELKDCTSWDAQANSVKKIIIKLSDEVVEKYK